MAWRTAHGARKNSLVRVETLPADELPLGNPAVDEPSKPEERDNRGRFTKGSRTAQQKGGSSRKATVKYSRGLGLSAIDESSPEFKPHMLAANAFRKAHVRWLAQMVGGGICSTGPSAIVAQAARAMSFSSYLYDQAAKTGDMSFMTGSVNYGDKARQALLTAHELCAKEAAIRAETMADDDAEQVAFQKSLVAEPGYQEFLEEAKDEVEDS